MDTDPDAVFGDDEDVENEHHQERDATKEMLVYLVDASPKMFSTTCPSEDQEYISHFDVAVFSILKSLKTQIINRAYDEVAICFFNTREKRNLQDLNGVYVYNVPDRDDLGRPTARLIRDFDCILGLFDEQIGSKYGIVSQSRENSLYNAILAAQALLRKGSPKMTNKRILLFTNEDDPFGNITGVTKMDMMRTTIQRAKDAQDLGISIELLPLSRPDDDFNMSTFYADLLGLDENDLAEFKALVAERFEDMNSKLRKHMFRKRRVRRIYFIIAEDISIELDAYALVRPTKPGSICWFDSVTNLPIKAERSFVCSDTGALVQEPSKYFMTYKNEKIMFSADELSEIKRISTGHLRLLGFKPISCLKDYHNLRPSTFVYPNDEEVVGSTCAFVALHCSMLRLKRYAVAFYGNPTHPQMVALIAQDEILGASGHQIEPPGMHMIFLPYSDDIRPVEDLHTDPSNTRATEDQIKSASSVVRRLDLKDFSVCQFANPALQRHYAVLEAKALDEDEIPEVTDETLPDVVGMSRPGIVKALEEFKLSVYGDDYDSEDEAMESEKTTDYNKKRKAIVDNATENYKEYDWSSLADEGKLIRLTVVELKYYLKVHDLPVTGNKEALISRILTHMGK